MAASQRVSRGFHRLALFLAAIPFLVGLAASLYFAINSAREASKAQQQAICANNYIRRLNPNPIHEENCSEEDAAAAGVKLENFFTWCATQPPKPYWLLHGPDDATLDLKSIGCSDSEYDTIGLGEARAVAAPFLSPWLDPFLSKFGVIFGITLAVSLAVYGVVRAIGWVIGGFAAT